MPAACTCSCSPMAPGGGVLTTPAHIPRSGTRSVLGTYPQISLKEARDKRDDARKLLSNGIDPGEQRKVIKATGAIRAANSFEVIGREWLNTQSRRWVKSHLDKQTSRLETHVFPWIGSRPITDLGVPDLRPILDRIVKHGHHEQSHRVLAAIGSVFMYAIATERAERNPARDLSVLLPPRRKKHYAHIKETAAVGDLMRAIDAFSGTFVVAAALKLAPLTFVRPGELRWAEWADFDLEHPEGAQWLIPPAKRKLLRAKKEDPDTPPHIVPLSTQAVALLRELKPLTRPSDIPVPERRDTRSAQCPRTRSTLPFHALASIAMS